MYSCIHVCMYACMHACMYMVSYHTLQGTGKNKISLVWQPGWGQLQKVCQVRRFEPWNKGGCELYQNSPALAYLMPWSKPWRSLSGSDPVTETIQGLHSFHQAWPRTQRHAAACTCPYHIAISLQGTVHQRGRFFQLVWVYSYCQLVRFLKVNWAPLQ